MALLYLQHHRFRTDRLIRGAAVPAEPAIG
jgi:hypothetical protein